MTDNIAESGKVPRNNSILFNEHSYHYPMIAITREEILCHEPQASISSDRVIAIIREENTILVLTFINSDLK
jgi:hypothetical protein